MAASRRYTPAYMAAYSPVVKDPSHVAQMEEHGIGTIDLIAVNLYPFAETVSKPDVTLMDALEQIDIGGPTMVRAAAKEFSRRHRAHRSRRLRARAGHAARRHRAAREPSPTRSQGL